MFLTQLFEERLSGTFNKYGQLIARNPISAIMFSIMLNGLLAINILWMRFNNELTVYAPSNSQAYKDSALVRNYFPDYTGTNFYEQSLLDLGRYGSIIIKSKNDGNLLNEMFQSNIQTIIKTVEEISIAHEDQTYLYQSLCARRNNTCVASHSVIFSDYFWKQVAFGNVTFPEFVTEDGRKELLDQTLGGVLTNADGLIISVLALKINFYLRQDRYLSNVLAKKWEQKFIDILQGFVSNEDDKNISIAFANSDSLGKELDANTGGDIKYFSLTFTLMITYASFVAAGGNCVSNTGHLGRAGVVASGLSILGALGLGSALQVEFVNIVGVMPFLIIGIGVDDMFILMSGLASAPKDKSAEERVGRTIQSSGVAITITSLTNVTAFAAGMLSTFQSVRNFCFYTGLAVLLCYVNQMTFLSLLFQVWLCYCVMSIR
ncbi:patched domain-containing protein 3-like isoform X2 [Mytilus trossulus]|uniref:patched domain-containing protein 3-like isoform X2 n=1 Tax=Mytilus trossulus TaxID=6551 RepID=UPI003007BCA0